MKQDSQGYWRAHIKITKPNEWLPLVILKEVKDTGKSVNEIIQDALVKRYKKVK